MQLSREALWTRTAIFNVQKLRCTIEFAELCNFLIPKENLLHLYKSCLLKLLSGLKLCEMPVTNDWTHKKSPQIYNVIVGTLEVVGNFRQSIKIWHFFVHSIVHIKFRTFQIAFFVHDTTSESCIKVWILVCGWYQVICRKSRFQIRLLPLYIPESLHFLPIGVLDLKILENICMTEFHLQLIRKIPLNFIMIFIVYNSFFLYFPQIIWNMFPNTCMHQICV